MLRFGAHEGDEDDDVILGEKEEVRWGRGSCATVIS